MVTLAIIAIYGLWGAGRKLGVHSPDSGTFLPA